MGFEDRGKDHKPRDISNATVEAGKPEEMDSMPSAEGVVLPTP